jgi:hypothetical protein
MSWSDLAWPSVAGLPIPHPIGKPPPRPLLSQAVLARMETRHERAVRGIAWLLTIAVGVVVWHFAILHATSLAGWLILGMIEAGVLVGILFLRRQMQGADLPPEHQTQWHRFCQWYRAYAAWLKSARQTYQAGLTPTQQHRLAEAIARYERSHAAAYSRSQV